MSAADLANDQDRELTVVTAERDDLQLRLDEAEAVIDAVRKVRDAVGRRKAVHYRRWNEHDIDDDGSKVSAYQDVLALLDEVDGL